MSAPVMVRPTISSSGFVRCGGGDRTALLRPNHPLRLCREQALYEVTALDGYRNVCADHLSIAVDLGMSSEEPSPT